MAHLMQAAAKVLCSSSAVAVVISSMSRGIGNTKCNEANHPHAKYMCLTFAAFVAATAAFYAATAAAAAVAAGLC
jgi:hypothetical protein